MNNIIRPGISPEYLTTNNVRRVSAEEAGSLCGCPAAGILLPYFDSDRQPVFDPTETPYARLRKEVVAPGSGKYHQRGGTGVHAYLPTNWEIHDADGALIVVEGEFKSLSLTDPAWEDTYPAVGISGFFGFHMKQEEGENLRPAAELQSAIEVLQPRVLYFLGDADTTLNHSFAVAACRLKNMYPDMAVILPRLPLGQEKGIDDCRANQRDQFGTRFRSLLANGMEVKPDMVANVLSYHLVEQQIPAIERMNVEQRTNEFPRILTLIAQTGQPVREELLKLFSRLLRVGKTELRKGVEKRTRELGEEHRQERIIQLKPRVRNYYYAGSQYLRRNLDNTYTWLSGRDNMLTHLEQEQGLVGAEAETALFLIQSENCVAFAGPIAGRPAGMHTNRSGGRILITEGPRIISGQAGNPDFIRSILEEFLGRGQDEYYEEQRQTFFGYLHTARKALRNPDVHLPGQALGLLGPVNVGKTFIQEHIITPCLGGRHTDPSDYFAQRTNFNDSMFSAEHLVLSDADIEPDDRARLKFRNQLKRVVANGNQVLSRRYESQVNIQPVWRLTLSANLDRHSLAIIPPLDASVRDKFILLKCYRPAGLPGSDPEERRAFAGNIEQALPALAFLLDHWPIPPEYHDGRYGVAAFQHPEILQLLAGSDPLRRFEIMLDRYVHTHGEQAGTAAEWLDRLKAEFEAEIEDLVTDAADLGRKFAALKRHIPGWNTRIDDSETRLGDQRNYSKVWKIS